MKKIILSITSKPHTNPENLILDIDYIINKFKMTLDSMIPPEILSIDYSIPLKKDKWDMEILLLSGLILGYSSDMIKITVELLMI